MMKKRTFWLIAGAVILFLLLGTGLLTFFYLLPLHLRQSEFPSWLERNQRWFRVGAVKSGNYNRIELEQLAVGNADRPLLAAPHAVLSFDYSPERNFGVPRFRELRLNQVRLNIGADRSKLTVNGYPVADFITALTELPPGPDGGTIPLLLDAEVATPGMADRPIACRIQIRREAEAGCFRFSGTWRADDGRNGEWEADLNRTAGEIIFKIRNEVGILFLQEFLLRAGAPVPRAALFRTGGIAGSGNFDMAFPAMKITLMHYAGTLHDGSIEWGGMKFLPEEPVAFEISGTPAKLAMNISALTLKTPLPLKIEDWQMEYRHRQPEGAFSARIDFGAALLRTISRRFGFAGANVYPVARKLTGTVHWKTGEWRCATETAARPAENWLATDGGGGGQLALQAENFQLSGEGFADRGSVEAQLKFAALELKNTRGNWRSDHGEIRAAWRFGEGRSDAGDTFEFHFDKIAGDTPQGQFELGNPAGELNIRSAPGGKHDFYLITRAEKYSLLTPQYKLDGDKMQSEIVAARQPDARHWVIQSGTFQSENAVLRYRDTAFQIVAPELRGSCAFTLPEKLNRAELRFSANSFRGGDWNFDRPNVRLTRSESDPAPSPVWHGQLDFRNGAIRIFAQLWQAADGKLEWSGPNCVGLPEKLEFSAATFQPRFDQWQGDFKNSSWQLQRTPDSRRYDCALTADAFRVQCPAGSGNFAHSKIQWQVERTADGRLKDFHTDFDTNNPSWSWRELHTGSETLKGSVSWEDPAKPSVRASLTAGNATLIGSYFSLLAPQLDLSGDYRSGQGASGRLRLADGSASSANGKLDLSRIMLDMPWNFETGGVSDRKTESGRLTVGSVGFSGRNEGSLSAVLTQSGSTLTGSGELVSSRLRQGKVKLQARIALPPREPALELAFDLSPAKLAGPLELKSWYRDCPAIATAGEFRLKGVLKSDFSTMTMSGTVGTADSDWMVENGVLEGVTGSVDFTDLAQLVSRPDAALTARRFKWKNWDFRDNRALLTFHPGHTLSISAWEGSGDGGKVRLTAPIRFAAVSDTPQEIPLPLAVSQLPLTWFMNRLGIDAVEGKATVSGTVNARYGNGVLRFGDSSLGFKSPAGELLKFGALERYAIQMRDPNYQAFALAVLRAMRCVSAQFDFSHQDDELIMKIRADGVPNAPVPFVYQGKDAPSPFRPANPGEDGFDGELELLVNLKLNADQPMPTGADGRR